MIEMELENGEPLRQNEDNDEGNIAPEVDDE